MKSPVRITVTGAAGQISYSLLFSIASGQMLGSDQPVALQLLEVPQAMRALEGVAMELDDCAFPLVCNVSMFDDAHAAFESSDYGLLVGARPRGPGMERSDLLAANGGIFTVQGKAINDRASRGVKILVVGNPANTNAWTCMMSAPDIEAKQFTAMTRLDHNRAIAQLSSVTNTPVSDIKKITIWGNHSSTQYPDLSQATVAGAPALGLVERSWYESDYIGKVAKRGEQIIDARGASSAASAANAAMEHMRDWALGTEPGNWTSMGVPSDGSYGIEEGMIYSFPVTCAGGEYSIVQDLPIDDFSRKMMSATAAELKEEQTAVAPLLG